MKEQAKPLTAPVRRLRAPIVLWFLVWFVAGITAAYAIAIRGDQDKVAAPTTGWHALRTQRVELVLVYLGSTTCAQSNDERVGNAVEDVLERLEEWASTRGMGFSSIGVAAAATPLDGYKHLAKIADFSEVSAGAAWTNAAFLWLSAVHPDVELATPQVLLLARIWASKGELLLPTDSLRQMVLVRKLGVTPIVNWAQSDSLLPPGATAWVERQLANAEPRRAPARANSRR